jgi:hypothetical protein
MSHPKPTIETGGLSAEATFLANLLAQNIDRLSDVHWKLVETQNEFDS